MGEDGQVPEETSWGADPVPRSCGLPKRREGRGDPRAIRGAEVEKVREFVRPGLVGAASPGGHRSGFGVDRQCRSVENRLWPVRSELFLCYIHGPTRSRCPGHGARGKQLNGLHDVSTANSPTQNLGSRRLASSMSLSHSYFSSELDSKIPSPQILGL